MKKGERGRSNEQQETSHIKRGNLEQGQQRLFRVQRAAKGRTFNSKVVNGEAHISHFTLQREEEEGLCQRHPKFALKMSKIVFALVSLGDWIKIETTGESSKLREGE